MTMQNITPPADRTGEDRTRLEEVHLEIATQRGTNWFYWIAGLTLVNTIISLVGGGISFSVALAFTQFLDAIGKGLGDPTRYVLIVADLIIVAVFVGFGILGGKGQTWATLTGTILYMFDGLLLVGLVVLGRMGGGGGGVPILGFIIHGLAIYYLSQGLIASRKLAAFRANRDRPGPPPPPNLISTMGNG
jgi:hypothetical protein